MLGEIVGRVWLLEPAAAWFLSDIGQGASDSPIPEDFWMANVEGADFVVKVESPSRQFGRQAICVFVDLCSDSGFLGAHLQRHLYPYSPPGAPYILHWPWTVQLHYSKLENPFPATEHHPTPSVI